MPDKSSLIKILSSGIFLFIFILGNISFLQAREYCWIQKEYHSFLPESENYFAEISACTVAGRNFWFGNDKPTPGGSVIFSIKDNENPLFYQGSLLENPFKIEGMTITPDQKWIFSNSAMYLRNENMKEPGFDSLFSLLVWPSDNPAKIKNLSLMGGNNPRKLYSIIANLLENRVFKMEGLAFYPPNSIFFGIRQQGKGDKKKYGVWMIKGTVNFRGEFPELEEKFELFPVNIDLSQLPYSKVSGLSSIEYHPQRKTFYLLTSFEKNKKGIAGGFLWKNDLQGFLSGLPFQPVLDLKGKHFEFKRKPEGLGIVNDSTIVVVYDDDDYIESQYKGEIRFKRKKNQFNWTILKLVEKKNRKIRIFQ